MGPSHSRSQSGNILVTGGAGYIGSHATLALLEAGYQVIVVDNLKHSSSESLGRVAKIAGRPATFVQGDIRNRALLDDVLSEYRISAVFHFAGLKSVEESIREPMNYYENNVFGTITLCQAMSEAGVFHLVFSSSATVYGHQLNIPFREDMPMGQPTNPYGRSKLMIEEMLRDLAICDDRWSVAVLRYFNPVGAHETGLIGEDPRGVPHNLLPCISHVATGKLAELVIFGGDYETFDGTGVRDYIHVCDLVDGHLKALQATKAQSGVEVWNLGSGRGYSVLEIVNAFETASRKSVPYRITKPRKGDIAQYWADITKAKLELGWIARRGLDVMMEDTWRWQSQNPDGYQ